jgi:uncharacterized protein DUF5916
MPHSFLLLLSLVLQAPDSASYRVTIPRVDTVVTVDGQLDEPVWQQAARINGFHQYQPVDSRPAEEDTEVLIWYAPTAIYFGIIARDKEPGGVRASSADRDNLDTEDRVTIYLDTFNDHRRAFFFTVNPLGVQEDGVRTEGGFSPGSFVGGSIDKNPDFLWQSKGRLTDSGYVVEIRVPFKSLRYPGAGPQAWGLNVLRAVQRTGYQDAWTDTRRANASFLLQSGTMAGLHDLQSGVSIDLQPFVTAQANGVRTATGFDRETVDPSAGVNLRLGLSSSLSLDATLNPDFSQVESDVSQVTVNERFALFFPEKRPFFLEGIELFATTNQLVYTRRVVDPLAGGKLTSKFGRYNLAYLTALDESGRDALFNIARIRRDFGSNSTIGVTATSRESDGRYNRVAAADVRVVFGKLYYVAGQVGGSWIRTTAAGSGVTSPIWEAEYDRTGRSWGFNYKVTGIGSSFRSDAGFVPRNDFVQAHGFNRVSFYGARGAFFESLSVFGGPSILWQYPDFPRHDPLEGNVSTDINLTVRGGWKWAGHGERGFIDFLPGAYTGYQEDRNGTLVTYSAPSGVDDEWSLSSTITTPTYQAFNATAKLTRTHGPIFQEGSAGNETRLTGSISVRPSSALRITGSNTFARITRGRDGSEFSRTIIPRIKTEYQATRSLFFRVVAEYVHQRRAPLEAARNGNPLYVNGTLAGYQESNSLRVDWLLSYEPVPGTVAFLGYGASYSEPMALRLSDLTRQNDGFFLKLAYQIRR